MALIALSIPGTVTFPTVPISRRIYVSIDITVEDNDGTQVTTLPYTVDVQTNGGLAGGIFIPQAVLGWTTSTTSAVRSPTINVKNGAPKTVTVVIEFLGSAVPAMSFGDSATITVWGSVTTDPPVFGPVDITLAANTDVTADVVMVMVLDRSGSMVTDVNGKSRAVRLREAASAGVALMNPNDQVGIVTFNQDATDIFTPSALNAGRGADLATLFSTTTLDARLDPSGSTSIGDGLYNANAMLGGTGVNNHILVFTDGIENTPRMLSDPQVTPISTGDTKIFAIGLGDSTAVSTASLNTLTNTTGKYLLVTGDIGGDQQFKLQKFFAQILYDTDKSSIIVDPEATIAGHAVQYWPFTITETDNGFDAVLFTESPDLLDFDLILPNGSVLDSTQAHLIPGGSFTRGPGILFFRFANPIAYGTWKGRVRLRDRSGKQDRKQLAEALGGKYAKELTAEFEAMAVNNAPKGVRYAFLAASPSDLSFEVSAQASGLNVGANLLLSATILEASLAVAGRASVKVEVTLPGGSVVTVPLTEAFPGRFSFAYQTLAAGAYQLRFMASGKTLHNRSYTREAIRTAYVLATGQLPPAPPGLADPGTDPNGTGGKGGPGGLGGSGGGGSDPYGIDGALGDIAKKYPELARVLRLCLLCCKEGHGHGGHSHCDCACHRK